MMIPYEGINLNTLCPLKDWFNFWYSQIRITIERSELLLSQTDLLLAQLRADVEKPMLYIDPKYCDNTEYHLNYFFHEGICKVQKGLEAQLTPDERDAIKKFLKPTGEAPLPTNDNLGYAERVLSSISESVKATGSAYECTDHVLPTFNVVERLFSMCKRTMSDHRKHLGPETLEGTVLLRINSNLWQHKAAKLIQEIMDEEAASAKAAREARSQSSIGSPGDTSQIADDLDKVQRVLLCCGMQDEDEESEMDFAQPMTVLHSITLPY